MNIDKLKKNKYKIFFILFLSIYILWANKSITITKTTIKSEEIPKGFSNFQIAQVSDLHNTNFGKNNFKLIQKLKSISPDIIVITGDILDSRRTNVDIALSFLEEAVKIAPVYYVTGNHERRIPSDFKIFEEKATNIEGVTFLRGESVNITKNNDTIQLVGVDDFRYFTNNKYNVSDIPEIKQKILKYIKPLNNKDLYSILLFHRPTLFEEFVIAEYDLVLTGHTHGGQFRLPFIGGLYANRKILPKYDAGLFTKDTTNMYVSRGLGNSLFPFRFNNRPELAIIELLHE